MQQATEVFQNGQVSAMTSVGSFFNQLFSQQGELELTDCSLPIRYINASVQLHDKISILHSVPGYSLSQLLRFILGLYGGPPGAFEVLHCKSGIAEQDLRLFMKRVIQHPRQYLILEINRLPYQLQEVNNSGLLV